jgi:cytoskeletal protein CcmA (bactofilin family)
VSEKTSGIMSRFVSTGVANGKLAASAPDVIAVDERAIIGTSTISADFTITGQIVCKGQAQLDGEVFGNVECAHLIVGKNGHIKGDIKADDVVVYGRVDGSISGARVALKSGGAVDGDIFHQGLSIEMGAVFLGKSARLADAASQPAAGNTAATAPRSNGSATSVMPK